MLKARGPQGRFPTAQEAGRDKNSEFTYTDEEN